MERMLSELRRDYPWHILFWGGYLLIKMGVVEYFRTDFAATALAETISLPLKIAAAYLLIYWLVPYYLLTRKYLKFILYVLLSITIVAFIRRVTDVFLIYPFIILYPDDVEFWNVLNMFRNLIYIYPVVGLGSAIYFVAHWVRNYHRNQELEKEKLAIELKMLKGQVNPHFLFNSINNIYALALEKSDKTPDALLKLSELLHSMLYECSGDKVALEKEVKLIHNYLDLEKLRYGDKVDIFFKVTGETEQFQISPLLLVPLVENSFKHGVSESIDKCWVNIDLNLKQDELAFGINNSKVKQLNGAQQHETGGIGLMNLKKRLALEYPNKYKFTIEENEDEFNVNLIIQNG